MTQENAFDLAKAVLLASPFVPYQFLEKHASGPIADAFMFFGPRSRGKLGQSYLNITSYAETVTQEGQDPKPFVRNLVRRLMANDFRSGRIISHPADPQSYRQFGHLEVDDAAKPYVDGDKGKFMALSIHGESDFDGLPKAEEIFNAKGIPRKVVIAIGPQHPFVEKKLNDALGKKGIEIASTKQLIKFYGKCQEAIQQNGGIVLHPDKNTDSEGYTVALLGKETVFPPLIFRLAKKHNLTTIPFFTFLDGNGFVCVRIDTPIPPNEPQVIAQRFAESVEILCRAHPDQVFGFMEKELREVRR